MKKTLDAGSRVKIAPSILSANFLRLEEELKSTEEAGADLLHVDIMDGRFVPNITIGPFIVQAIKGATSIPLDVHLMVGEPEKYIKDFINAGAYYLTVHIEAVKHLDRTVKFIRSSGARAGLALNPATPLASLEEILQETDLVVLMSVNPGFGGQEFIPYVTEKIKKLRAALDERNPGCLIEVDGGIGPKNAREIALAGADILVMGSAFYRSGDYKRLASQVRKLLEPKVRK